MGQSISNHRVPLTLWENTIAQIVDYERQEWEKVTPGNIRLALYWMQMLAGSVEVVFRVAFHATSFFVVLPYYVIAVLYLKHKGMWSEESTHEVNFQRVASSRSPGAERHWPVLPYSQIWHHELWLTMYFNYFPSIISHNLMNPRMPFFVDGRDITIYRPPKPYQPKTSSCFFDCCDELCNCCAPDCLGDCSRCCDLLLSMGLRYLQSSFIALSGYHALQCGTCCGPCIRPCCYDPCVGNDTDRGLCKMCEVDEIRSRRWLREEHEEKAKRSNIFYDKHPDLMRPDAGMTNVSEGTRDPRIAALLGEQHAPNQQRLTNTASNRTT